MSVRGFLSNQLLEAEVELMAVGKVADELGMTIGEHADEIHWDKMLASSPSEWLSKVAELRYRLDRAQGLLNAYEIHRKANGGE